MTKESYLQALEGHLKKHMSKSEIEDILRDYEEYFDDGRRQNKTDIEISAKLGDPQIIAQQFIEEYGNNPKSEKLDQTLHTLKEGTEKTFATLKKGTEKTFATLKKGTEKTLRSAGDKMADTNILDTAKQGVSHVGQGVKNGTNSIFDILKSICLFFIFAFLQLFFIAVVYSFCIGSAFFFAGCGISGIFCLGFSIVYLPLLISLAVLFITIASFALSGLFLVLTYYILKNNIILIKKWILSKKKSDLKREAL